MDSGWKAPWIGYEVPELRALREANAAWVTFPGTNGAVPPGHLHHGFRFHFDLSNKIQHADLFVTGEDTTGAWVNGKQVFATEPLPGSDRLPWKTFRQVDVTAPL